MTDPRAAAAPTAAPTGCPVPLVPGELRGYRQFRLLGDALHPVVPGRGGPWAAGVHVATCLRDPEHAAPAADCTCGLYGWHRPSAATGTYGGVHAVVAARGRVVLADRGFRAEAARVEAIALPPTLRLRSRARRRLRDQLAQRYPQTTLYSSRRRMLRDHPPGDLTALGILVPPDTRRRHLWAALALWGVFGAACYAVAFLPREAVAEAGARWWPLLLAVVVGWQVALAALLTRSSD